MALPDSTPLAGIEKGFGLNIKLRGEIRQSPHCVVHSEPKMLKHSYHLRRGCLHRRQKNRETIPTKASEVDCPANRFPCRSVKPYERSCP